jgi:hypothetical protein
VSKRRGHWQSLLTAHFLEGYVSASVPITQLVNAHINDLHRESHKSGDVGLDHAVAERFLIAKERVPLRPAESGSVDEAVLVQPLHHLAEGLLVAEMKQVHHERVPLRASAGLLLVDPLVHEGQRLASLEALHAIQSEREKLAGNLTHKYPKASEAAPVRPVHPVQPVLESWNEDVHGILRADLERVRVVKLAVDIAQDAPAGVKPRREKVVHLVQAVA